MSTQLGEHEKEFGSISWSWIVVVDTISDVVVDIISDVFVDTTSDVFVDMISDVFVFVRQQVQKQLEKCIQEAEQKIMSASFTIDFFANFIHRASSTFLQPDV
jgi:hypothetical protein